MLGERLSSEPLLYLTLPCELLVRVTHIIILTPFIKRLAKKTCERFELVPVNPHYARPVRMKVLLIFELLHPLGHLLGQTVRSGCN